MTEESERTHAITVQGNTRETYIHGAIVFAVLISATLLRIEQQLDSATISTVYGATLGYATGLTMNKKGDCK